MKVRAAKRERVMIEMIGMIRMIRILITIRGWSKNLWPQLYWSDKPEEPT